jgi:hypothetical protein
LGVIGYSTLHVLLVLEFLIKQLEDSIEKLSQSDFHGLVFAFSTSELELQKFEKGVEISDAADYTEPFEVFNGQLSYFSRVDHILEGEA